ncbi:MAG: hypothetical protein J6K84_04135 [Oscillospiraceae bacterium]|nr:hypothetical protein [Oscillospiraceae bacterium]
MKKGLSLVALVLVLVLALSACDTDPVKKVTDEIAAIGEVKVSSQEAIQSARESFDALDEKLQAKVENIDVLLSAEKTLEELLQIKAVEDLISDIGTVTIDSLPAIEKAEKALADLPAELQEKVEIAWLIASARSEYQDCLIVKEVDDLFAALPANPTMADRAQIEAARTAFAALQPKHQGLVKNYALLTAAEEVLAPLCHAEAEKILKSFAVVEDSSSSTKTYYPAVFPLQNNSVAYDKRTFVLPYLVRSAEGVKMHLVCNFASSDYVFFKKIAFTVDGQELTQTISYFDVVRGNSAGKAWEYFDVAVSSSDLALLQKIVPSNTAVICFAGDEISSDEVISAKDKEAIRQCLEVYTLLNY